MVCRAQVKLPEGTSLAPCSVVYGSSNSVHTLPRTEEELAKARVVDVDRELALLHREFKKIPAIRVRPSNV